MSIRRAFCLPGGGRDSVDGRQTDRDRLIRDFVKKTERAHDGEFVSVVVRT
jgi:hypothetical protein